MAKTTPGLRDALKAVNALGRNMTREADADYGVASSASAAGTANLLKQTQALGRSSLLTTKANRLAIEAQALRAAAAPAQVGEAQARSVARYGGALSGAASTSYGLARATATAQAKILAGQAGQARKQSAVTRVMQGITEQGVAAQGAAAEYALAQALQQRAIIDNQTLAGLTGDLYQSAIDYNNQWTLWKRQQDYAERKAEEAGGTAERNTARALMNEGPALAVSAADAWREYRDEWYEEDGTLKEDAPDFNIGETANTWAVTNGFDPQGPEAQLYITTLQKLKSGMNAPEAFAAAMDKLYAGSEGYQKWGDAVVAAGMADINAQAKEAYLDYMLKLKEEQEEDAENTTFSLGTMGGNVAPPSTAAPLYTGRTPDYSKAAPWYAGG